MFYHCTKIHYLNLKTKNIRNNIIVNHYYKLNNVPLAHNTQHFI